MQLYLIYEATLDDIKNRIPIFIKKYFKNDNSKETLELIKQLAEVDPTRGKYTEWIIKNHLNGKIIIPEDNEKITNLLNRFHQNKNKLNDKDIFNYRPGDLSKALDNLQDSKRQIKRLGRKGELGPLPDGAKHIRSVGEYDVVKIISPSASSILCSGTQWCTANQNTAAEYLKDGPLYLVYKHGERYALIHPATGQAMDIHDNEFDSGTLIKLLDVANLDYDKHPEWAYTYAVDIIGDRWFEGEEIIKTDPEWACLYAKDVIKGKWPEAEDIIKTKPDYAYLYAFGVIKDRWPEGEETIKTDPYWAYFYAKDVIKDRWPEGEKAIKTDPTWAFKYAEDVVGGRWLEGEEAIKRDPRWAYYYALLVVKGRWPEGEEAIKKNKTYYINYKQFIIDKTYK